jgi:Cu-Zn family superoxide dismutase
MGTLLFVLVSAGRSLTTIGRTADPFNTLPSPEGLGYDASETPVANALERRSGMRASAGSPEETTMKKVVVVLSAVALAACTSGRVGRGHGGVAELASADGKKHGTATFDESGGKVRIVVDADGLFPGKHGVHIHAIGMCQDPAFMSAGGHFNPTMKKHGLDSADGSHGGDLPNLEADKNGKAHYDVTTDRVTLGSGNLSVFDTDGSTLVIHEKEDDQKTDPAGDSGARVLCGVIKRPS